MNYIRYAKFKQVRFTIKILFAQTTLMIFAKNISDILNNCLFFDEKDALFF